MKLHRWTDIENRNMTLKRTARSDARVARASLAIRLEAVRKAAGLTQQELGKRATFSQSQLSKLERSGNVELATLIRYVSAAGGDLEISAVLNGERLVLLSSKAKGTPSPKKPASRLPRKPEARKATIARGSDAPCGQPRFRSALEQTLHQDVFEAAAAIEDRVDLN